MRRARCSNLQELHLEDLERQFTSRALLMVGKLCSNLHTLVLPGILEHPDEVIEPIISYLPNLRVFKSFSQFTDSTFKCLAQRCTRLQKLRFGTHKCSRSRVVVCEVLTGGSGHRGCTTPYHRDNDQINDTDANCRAISYRL